MSHVNRVTVSIDGEDESNFKAFRKGAVKKRGQVALMNKNGTSRFTGRYSFGLDYVVPEVGERDWESDDLEDLTVVVAYENGASVQYRKAAVEEVGEETIDGEGEVIRPIQFIAEDKKNL